MTRRRIAVVVAVLLLVGLAWGMQERLQHRLIVENRSGKAVTVMRITIGGETAVFHDIPDQATAESAFRIVSDDHFIVDGQLTDGTIIRGKFGYVTNSTFGERATFVIGREGGIRFEQSGVY